jgi:hypothetical protein
MCLRLSSREKKKNRNSPSRKTVGDKQAPPLASHHSLASPSEKGKSSCSRSDTFRPRAMGIRCLHLSNAVWAGPVSALRWGPLSAYAADGKRATCSKAHAVQLVWAIVRWGHVDFIGTRIVGDAFRLLYRKPGGLVISIGP